MESFKLHLVGKKALFLESWNNLKDMIAIIKAWLDK